MTAPAPARAALQALAGRYGLSATQRAQLGRLLRVLEADARAPTSVRSPALAVNAHIADSLVALELEVTPAALSIADLGTGAGFPGVVLAIALPASTVNLIESQRSKCAFLAKALAELALENAQIVCERAELWAAGRGGQDLVVARALASQPVVLEYAAPLLRQGGALLDWRGRRALDEERMSLRAAAELGLDRVAVHRVQPFARARTHHLHLFVKAGETPARFPRRAGAARKRPLGGAV